MLSEVGAGLRPLCGREPEAVDDRCQRGIDATAFTVRNQSSGHVHQLQIVLFPDGQNIRSLPDAGNGLDAVGKTEQRPDRAIEVMKLATLEHSHNGTDPRVPAGPTDLDRHFKTDLDRHFRKADLDEKPTRRGLGHDSDLDRHSCRG